MRGFNIKIGEHEYYVSVHSYADTSVPKSSEYSLNMNLRLDIYENGKKIKLNKNSYAVEKITDMIINTINGQHTCYWDGDKNSCWLEESK